MDSPPPVEEQVSAGAVKVEVLDEDGIPIPGVWVRLSGVGVLGALEVSTDADGKADRWWI